MKKNRKRMYENSMKLIEQLQQKYVRFRVGLLNHSILIVVYPGWIRDCRVRNQNHLFPSVVTKTGAALNVATAPARECLCIGGRTVKMATLNPVTENWEVNWSMGKSSIRYRKPKCWSNAGEVITIPSGRTFHWLRWYFNRPIAWEKLACVIVIVGSTAWFLWPWSV